MNSDTHVDSAHAQALRGERTAPPAIPDFSAASWTPAAVPGHEPGIFLTRPLSQQPPQSHTPCFGEAPASQHLEAAASSRHDFPPPAALPYLICCAAPGYLLSALKGQSLPKRPVFSEVPQSAAPMLPSQASF